MTRQETIDFLRAEIKTLGKYAAKTKRIKCFQTAAYMRGKADGINHAITVLIMED